MKYTYILALDDTQFWVLMIVIGVLIYARRDGDIA